jgi:glycosyltransferase involved in cell wall biosynthesis
MRLVFSTQVVDGDDPHLGQTLDLLRALAGRCDELTVLCDRVARHDLPANVSFRTFGARGKLGRGLSFERALLRAGRPDAFLAHMVPRFLLLAAPVCRLRRVPLLLWYTHWNASHELRLATRLADAVLSVRAESFPLRTPKVCGVGHGIDLARFEPRSAAPEGRAGLHVLVLGRTEPRKRLDLLLDAVERGAERGLELRVEIRGPQITDAERAHRRELEERVGASPLLSERVSIEDAVPRERVPELIRAADVVVSSTSGDTPAGALDKVAYEAAACAVPVVASNPNFADLLRGLPGKLLFAAGDVDSLVDVLDRIAALSPAERDRVGCELRRRVEQSHSAANWANGVVDVVRELSGP